jgi:hypothetical protein
MSVSVRRDACCAEVAARGPRRRRRRMAAEGRSVRAGVGVCRVAARGEGPIRQPDLSAEVVVVRHVCAAGDLRRRHGGLGAARRRRRVDATAVRRRAGHLLCRRAGGSLTVAFARPNRAVLRPRASHGLIVRQGRGLAVDSGLIDGAPSCCARSARARSSVARRPARRGWGARRSRVRSVAGRPARRHGHAARACRPARRGRPLLTARARRAFRASVEHFSRAGDAEHDGQRDRRTSDAKQRPNHRLIRARSVGSGKPQVARPFAPGARLTPCTHGCMESGGRALLWSLCIPISRSHTSCGSVRRDVHRSTKQMMYCSELVSRVWNHTESRTVSTSREAHPLADPSDREDAALGDSPDV